MKAMLLSVLVITVLFSGALLTNATAGDRPPGHGDLYELDMEWIGADVGPVHVILKVYEGKTPDPAKLKGTSEADFDGATMTGLMFDTVAEITQISTAGGELTVAFTANGYDGGTFKADSYFEVLLDGVSSGLNIHTSCSKVLRMGYPYGCDPVGSGNIFIVGGDGDCLVDRYHCPEGNKLYWVIATLRVPDCGPADLAFRFYKGDDDLQAESLASFDGFGLYDVVCDRFACITDAAVIGGDLIVTVEAFGPKGGGEFDASSRFELEVGGCDTYYRDLHTSCSQPIHVHEPYEMTPLGELILVDGCGCLENVSPVQQSTWGLIKGLYR